MRKVHISLVGKETVPIYLGIKEAEPDLVFLICSSNTKTEAERIVEQFPNIEIKTIEFEPMNLGRIFSDIKELEKQLLEDDIISLNLVGGTKFWSLAFYSIFGVMDNVSVNLVDQQNKIWEFRTKTYKQLDFDFDIEKVLKLYGNPLVKYTPFCEYTQADFDTANAIKNIRQTNFNDFNNLTITIPSKGENKNTLNTQNKGSFFYSKSSVDWEKPDYVTIDIQTKKGLHLTELRSPHAVELIFNSHWFEVQIAKLLSNFYNEKEIYLKCKFLAKTGADKNEVDIIINTGNKLLFVECKTQINSTTDIDKFSTVVGNYGGKGSKALFVTDAKMSQMAIEKCEDLNIAHFSMCEYDKKHPDKLIERLNKFVNGVNK